MNAHQEKLRAIRRACGLGPLDKKNLDQYWVDTDEARDPQQSIRESLRLRLGDNRDVRLLFYGHGGSGKSTELAKLVQELGDNYYVVAFSVRNEMSFIDVTSEDLIMVLMERLLSKAKNDDLPINAKALEGMHEYFATVTSTQERTKEASGSLSSPALLALLAKLFLDLKAEIKLEAKSTETRAQKVRQRPGELLNQANILINSVRHALPKERRLLFMVEDLDKLDISTARKVFVEKTNILTGIGFSVIYTIPIFVFHSPDASLLRRQFDGDFSLPMIKVAEPQGARAKGFEVVKRIILQRLGPDSLTTEALDLLVEKTGGVLQHAFEVLGNAALMRNATVPLEPEHIRYALQRKKSEFWSEITLPSEPVQGLESKNQLFDRLRDCLTSQRGGRPCNPSGDGIDQVLLKCCALVEYNGKRWYGVHPLVQEMIDELGDPTTASLARSD